MVEVSKDGLEPCRKCGGQWCSVDRCLPASPQLLPVTQDDRKAAWTCRPWGILDTVATVRSWNAGNYDAHDLIQAFARHRIEATATLQAERDRYRVALEACADQFAFYAREHQSAGKTEKAATNQRFADIARNALSDTPTVQS